MTAADFEFLKTPAARQLVAENLTAEPSELALRLRSPALATQVKYLQRAQSKLPSWFAAQAIVPPLAFEQSSSELAAGQKLIFGKTCLDLTCGLGVDSHQFSKNFEHVVSLERDAVLASVVRFNFELFGCKNVEILNETAENFLKNYKNEPFDWIFLDPARRDFSGKKTVALEDCEPNFVELLPRLRQIGRRILVKLSPLFDVEAAAKKFPDVYEIGVLSIQNECKEVWLRFEEQAHFPPKLVVRCGSANGLFLTFEKPENDEPCPSPTADFEPKFVVEPDVAFYKSRLVEAFFGSFFPDFEGELTAPMGFFVSQNEVENAPARSFKIVHSMAWQPKKWSAFLKEKGIGRLNVVVRNFPLSAAQIRATLRASEGGEWFFIATVWRGERVAWLCKKEVSG